MRTTLSLLLLAITLGFATCLHAESPAESEIAILRAQVRALETENELLKLRIHKLERRPGIASADAPNEYRRSFPGTKIPVDLGLLSEYLTIQKDAYEKDDSQYVLTVRVKRDMTFNNILAVMGLRLDMLDADGVVIRPLHGDLQPAFADAGARAGEVHRLTYPLVTKPALEECVRMVLREK